MTSSTSVARDAHLAYLNRKLDIQERLIALKERELTLQECEFALRARMAEVLSGGDDGDADEMPTPSFPSRGRA